MKTVSSSLWTLCHWGVCMLVLLSVSLEVKVVSSSSCDSFHPLFTKVLASFLFADCMGTVGSNISSQSLGIGSYSVVYTCDKNSTFICQLSL